MLRVRGHGDVCMYVCIWCVSSRLPRENPLQDGRSVTQQLWPGEASVCMYVCMVMLREKSL